MDVYITCRAGEPIQGLSPSEPSEAFELWFMLHESDFCVSQYREIARAAWLAGVKWGSEMKGEGLQKHEFLEAAKDHYWDSLEPERESVIKHIEGIIAYLGKQGR